MQFILSSYTKCPRGILCLLVILIISITSSYTQNKDTITLIKGVGLNIHGGDIFIHSPKIDHFNNATTGSLEGSLLWKTTGQKPWQTYYNHPIVGGSVMVTNFGHNEMLGQAYSVFPHLTLPLLDNKNMYISFKGGTGLAYLNRPYNRLENRFNNAIGSHINNIIHGSVSAKWQIRSKWQFYSGLSFTHFSNGAYASPNLGINIPAFQVGVKRYFKEFNATHFRKEKPDEYDRSIHFSGRIGVGVEEDAIPNGPKYPVYSLTLAAERKIGPYNKLSLGGYTAFSYSAYDYMKLHGIRKGKQRDLALRIGLEIGDEFLFHNVGLIGKVGVYLNNQLFQFDPVYTRLGIKHYFINHRLFVGVYLKAHRSVADYAEGTIGVRF